MVLGCSPAAAAETATGASPAPTCWAHGIEPPRAGAGEIVKRQSLSCEPFGLTVPLSVALEGVIAAGLPVMLAGGGIVQVSVIAARAPWDVASSANADTPDAAAGTPDEPPPPPPPPEPNASVPPTMWPAPAPPPPPPKIPPPPPPPAPPTSAESPGCAADSEFAGGYLRRPRRRFLQRWAWPRHRRRPRRRLRRSRRWSREIPPLRRAPPASGVVFVRPGPPAPPPPPATTSREASDWHAGVAVVEQVRMSEAPPPAPPEGAVPKIVNTSPPLSPPPVPPSALSGAVAAPPSPATSAYRVSPGLTASVALTEAGTPPAAPPAPAPPLPPTSVTCRLVTPAGTTNACSPAMVKVLRWRFRRPGARERRPLSRRAASADAAHDRGARLEHRASVSVSRADPLKSRRRPGCAH